VLAITGTNGKTTTTALTAHLLVAGGLKAVSAGNIGRPLSAVALEDDPPDWLAVELSSFQLHDMPSLAPTAGILTNLSPDHLDRYAALADYYADKAQLFRNANDTPSGSPTGTTRKCFYRRWCRAPSASPPRGWPTDGTTGGQA
jgi:UDP-N-acetylmuramoylalanine--D-glutamate ligase